MVYLGGGALGCFEGGYFQRGGIFWAGQNGKNYLKSVCAPLPINCFVSKGKIFFWWGPSSGGALSYRQTTPYNTQLVLLFKSLHPWMIKKKRYETIYGKSGTDVVHKFCFLGDCDRFNINVKNNSGQTPTPLNVN